MEWAPLLPTTTANQQQALTQWLNLKANEPEQPINGGPGSMSG